MCIRDRYPEGQDASTSVYLGWFNWPFVREQFNKPSGRITQEALDAEQEWLKKDNFVVSPLTGFNPDTSTIKTELAQRDQLYAIPAPTVQEVWEYLFPLPYGFSFQLHSFTILIRKIH